ncbi:SDR family NAD(P)-dependent oxidoreductase [Lutimonas zeaxanthinifaciens]|uniref:SDR family NAD(P)-dependent oxidoreductase n=1 Tax=Lutimonas zeaxanthinifaciens TaxID=3060215 RepID=UPI00265D01D5|nr:SDR family oxidoreductase [Lutimonas sp. YSD2104]WKK64657.1 SDR family oxidoreductase [Lutimonas sp. YSD2104]
MKKVLIVGGSRGIGRAVVQKMNESYELISISRSASEDMKGSLVQYTCDVLTDELPHIEELEGLVYCPGTINLKPFTRLSESDFKEDFELNVLGAVRVIQKYLKLLKNGNDSSVVLFSTVAVKMGMPFHASIAVAKAGVEALVKSLGAELSPGIRFNAIAPTITDTSLAEKILRNDAMKEKMKERHPMKSYLEPNDVAEMTEFLISDKSKKISGQIFELDCGIVTFKI